MKNISFFIVFYMMLSTSTNAQKAAADNKLKQNIYSLIDQYAQAREKKDSVLLHSILATEVDQLVSSGEWRIGKSEAVKGMMRSSNSNPGSRSITIEKIRLIDSEFGIVDARYEIKNTDGSTRKMWSTFIIVYMEERWKITAIRNMLPTRQD